MALAIASALALAAPAALAEGDANLLMNCYNASF